MAAGQRAGPFDLHGLRVEPAVELVRATIHRLLPRTRAAFVSGAGKHSEGGVSRIRVALAARLDEWGVLYTWESGVFHVVVPEDCRRVPAAAAPPVGGAAAARPAVVVAPTLVRPSRPRPAQVRQPRHCLSLRACCHS